MTGRRAFAGGVAAVLALASFGAGAQRSRPARIAILMTGTPESHGYLANAFVEGMRKLGYVEGQDVVYSYRWARGRTERYEELVRELAREDPDIFVTGTAAVTRAAAQSAPRAAILMAYGSDPVGNKLIATLARPGGRITGLSNQGEGFVPKMIELLHAMVPRAQRIAVLVNPGNLTAATFASEAKVAAGTLKLAVTTLEAAAPEAFAGAFERMKRERVEGVVVTADPMFLSMRTQLVDLAARARVPAIYFHREFVVDGGLVSYGSSIRDSFMRAAAFADKILKGADPGTLPVEQPTKFELALNLKTAKALGLTIPQALLLRADEVIQ